MITPASEMETIIYSSSTNKNAPIYEVEDESDSDAVLFLEVKLPEDEYSSKFYLKRNLKPQSGYLGSSIGYGFASCGATSEGKGVGLGGSVSLSISQADIIQVEMSFYWTSPKGNKGKLDGSIAVSWLGEATKDMGQGVQARLSFLNRTKSRE